jgi:hypothetical protein
MTRAEALAAAELLEECRARPCVDETLSGALGLAAFAVRHEVGAVFGRTLAGVEGFDDEKRRGRAADANATLSECFEQCLITLARVFDSRLDRAALFDDAATKRTNSLRLCHDLASLLDATRRAQRLQEPSVLWLFGERLEYFHAERMRLLMLQDWQVFERFVEEWRGVKDEEDEAGRFLRRFGSYLEFLLGRVCARSVLAAATSGAISQGR